ncbi:MAG: four helix bundle protein [Cyclobacteriaceae bacterium]
MSTITRFEDLTCWQAARELVKMVYLVSKTGELAKDFGTKDQFRRAALSSMNNIAEDFGRFGRKDFIRFLNFSQSSSLEVQSMLYVLSDLEYLKEEKIIEIRRKSEETKNLTLACIKYLSNTLDKKPKKVL